MLKPRQPTPDVAVETLHGDTWRLSEQTPAAFTMILFYRGYHCPICRRYLRDIDNNLAKFTELGVEVIAISSDGQARAQKSWDEWELSNITVGYGLDLDKAREWGLYISNAIKEKEPEIFSEPGLFFIRPDGTLFMATVQTMPFARPTANQLLQAVSYIVENNYPARGEA